ncbi:anti-sigma factor [Roseomonas eburnea]|uniref:Anti-sigma factor n=1 Tax=Neoroseomonas eburnea TaxID=1346889 RepID=A0A9X9X789_9PROT|nr:anti-sigma factor [Neoroseomonas eburnea]MBR0679575.1 anti-sigma factor [Neoroseomonas eburnea]
MTGPAMPPVGEDDLHAFVDGRLDPARRAAVAAWLERHPADAARLRGWQEDAAMLRAALAPVAEEPLPARLRVAGLAAARRRWAPVAARRIAASVMLLAIGAASGWWVARQEDAAVGPPMADALAAHRVYAGRGSGAVEIAAAEGVLAERVAAAVGWQVPVPDLSALGLRPLGARVLPTEDGLAAFVLYEGAGGERLSLFVRRSRRAGPAAPEVMDREAPLRAAVWFRDGFGHAVVGEGAPKAVLLRVAALSGG